MVCGSSCFIINFKKDGENRWERVKAKTPAKARKVLKKEMGPKITIISVRNER